MHSLKLIALGLCLLLSCKSSPQQTARQAFLQQTLIPGLGASPVFVDKTSLDELETLFGKADKQESSQGTSSKCVQGKCKSTPFEMIDLRYPKEGLWFEFRKDEGQPPRLVRLGVQCEKGNCPFTGSTNLGIKLQQTRAELLEIHGKPLRKSHNNWIMLYPTGIGFGLNNAPGDRFGQPEDTINSIQILSREHENLNKSSRRR